VSEADLDARAPMTLYARIKEELRSAILDGSYKPFDQLPSESELTTRFAVSRITVRQALNDLQKEGLIFKVHGKGSFVSKPKTDQDLTRLQGFAEALSGEGHEINNRVLSLRNVRAGRQVAQKLRMGVGDEVTEIRRLRFLDREPISVDISYAPPELGARLAKADLPSRDIFIIFENDFGIPLGNAELLIEATSADEELAGHLRVREGAPLLRIERLTSSAGREPLFFEYLFYRGDAFRYRLTIDRRPPA